MQAYYGYTVEPLVVEIFTAERKPTRETHPQYAAVVGPYRHKAEARNAIRFSNRFRNAELRIL